MKKTFLIAALALIGATAPALAATIESGKAYSVKYVGEHAGDTPLYLNMMVPGAIIDGTSDHNASLSTTPTPIVFTVKGADGDNASQFLISTAEKKTYLYVEGAGWNAATRDSRLPAAYWFVNVVDETSDELKVTIRKSNTTGSVYLAGNNADSYVAGKSVYCDKQEAAQWLLEPYTAALTPYYDAPVASTADAPKYYRIASCRALDNTETYGGPYLNIAGEANASGLNQLTNTGVENYGSYWRFEQTGTEGAVIIRNLISDYALTKTSGNFVRMTAEGTPFHIINVTGVNGITIPNSFAISTSKPYGDGTCMDQSNYKTDGLFGSKVEWSPAGDVGVGTNNNGSVWFFEEVTEAEVAAASEAYINAVKEKYNELIANANANEIIATLESLSGVFDVSDAIAEARDYNFAEAAEFTATTIAEANAAIRGVGTIPADLISEKTLAAMTAGASGKFVQIKSRLVSGAGHNHSFLTPNAALDGMNLNNDITDNPIRSLWEFVKSDADGKFYLRNVYADKFVKLGGQDVNCPLVETDGDNFMIRYSVTRNGFGIDTGNSLAGAIDALHATTYGSNGAVVRWDLTADNSWFDFVAADGVIEVTSAKGDNEGEVVLDFGSATPTANAAYTADSHKLIVTPVTNERSVAVGSEIAASEINDGKVTVTGFTPGEYTITAPAGFFTVDGKLSAPLTSSFTVNNDGTSTGIEEIGAAQAGKQVIYDLQGRRVQRAAKGLYIINGVKTLVK